LVVVLPALTYFGYRLGQATYVKHGFGRNPPRHLSGDTSLGAILALLGLLLAFSYASSLSWSDARNRALVDEAMAIGNAFQSADLLPEPGRAELQKAILGYARTRHIPKESFQSSENLQAFIQHTMAMQGALWPVALDAVGGETPAPIQTFILGNVSWVLDAHMIRFMVGSESLPLVVKLMLFLSAALALVIAGNKSALQGRPVTWRTFALAGLISVVMIVILDLDRPRDGLITINSDAMRVTISDLELLDHD
jgi:hypothetical protein